MTANLFVGTSAGAYSVASGQARLLGLPKQIVTHLGVGQNVLLAAVPKRGPVHSMTQLPEGTSDHRPGLHVVAAIGAEPVTEQQWRQVWEGDARSCAVADGCWFVGEQRPLQT